MTARRKWKSFSQLPKQQLIKLLLVLLPRYVDSNIVLESYYPIIPFIHSHLIQNITPLQDKATGAFAEAWSAALAASELPVVDISTAVGTLLSAKAAYLVSSAMNNRGVKDIEGERCWDKIGRGNKWIVIPI